MGALTSIDVNVVIEPNTQRNALIGAVIIIVLWGIVYVFSRKLSQ